MQRMTEAERTYYDAQARLDAWEYALLILRPWVESARAIGHEELVEAMEKALELAVDRSVAAQDDMQAVEDEL